MKVIPPMGFQHNYMYNPPMGFQHNYMYAPERYFCCKSAIWNLIELKILRTYPFLKPHMLFHSNGLAIWHGLPDRSTIKIKKAIVAE